MQVLGDQLGIPSRLVQKPNGQAWNEVFVPIRNCKLNLEPNYIINMDRLPVELIKINSLYSEMFKEKHANNPKVQLTDKQLYRKYPYTKNIQQLFNSRIFIDQEDYENFEQLFFHMPSNSLMDDKAMKTAEKPSETRRTSGHIAGSHASVVNDTEEHSTGEQRLLYHHLDEWGGVEELYVEEHFEEEHSFDERKSCRNSKRENDFHHNLLSIKCVLADKWQI